jgi:uncharacterized lipoprotein YajG
MTPKEKAKKLVDKYKPLSAGFSGGKMNEEFSKQGALIAVNEIIANIVPSVSMDVIEARIKYWQEVKQEIENL